MNVPTPLQVLLSLFSLSAATATAAPDRPRPTIVFVCEHGTVKSLIAREWFNRMAAERGLDVRAVSRGVTPDAAVPTAIAEALRGDGFEVAGFEPQALSEADAQGALRVVAIGVDLTGSPARGRAVETWEGIPPASERYPASRDALRARIEDLLKVLENAKPKP